MDFKDIAESVAKMGAPILGGILLGPAGAAAGAALAAKFGAGTTEPAAIAQKIESDPDASGKLLELQELQLKLHYSDKANARELKETLAKAGVIESRPTVIAYSLFALLSLIVTCLFLCIFLKINVPEPYSALLAAIVGFLTGKLSSVVDFDFGDSADKK